MMNRADFLAGVAGWAISPLIPWHAPEAIEQAPDPPPWGEGRFSVESPRPGEYRYRQWLRVPRKDVSPNIISLAGPCSPAEFDLLVPLPGGRSWADAGWERMAAVSLTVRPDDTCDIELALHRAEP